MATKAADKLNTARYDNLSAPRCVVIGPTTYKISVQYLNHKYEKCTRSCHCKVTNVKLDVEILRMPSIYMYACNTH